MPHKIIIAIDGYSSCGKSTIAKELAEKLQYLYIDTGAMYRAVAYYLLKNNIDPENIAAVKKALRDIDISFIIEEDGKPHTYLNGKKIEREIRSMKVSQIVSKISAIKEVRQELVNRQREMGRKKGVVMDGRDIGTVVFPDAELKLFVTADLEERAKRRYKELKHKHKEVTFEEVKHNLEHRDQVDENRKEGPLKKAPDAIKIDTTRLSHSEQLEMAYRLAKERMNC